MQLCQSFTFSPLLQGALTSVYLATQKPFQNALSNDANQGIAAHILWPVYQHAGLRQVIISSIAEGPQCMTVLGKERKLCKAKSPFIITVR